MAYSVLQTLDYQTFSAGSSIVTGSYTLTAGSRVVFVAQFYGGTDTTTGCTDTNGNTWTKIAGTAINFGGGGGAMWVAWECKNVTTGGATVITVALSASTGQSGIAGLEVSGLDPTASAQAYTPVTQSAPGTGTDGVTNTAITPTSQPAMVFAFAQNISSTASLVAGTGFNGYALPNASGFNAGSKSIVEEKRITSTASVAATATTGNGAGVVTFIGLIVPEYVAPSNLDPITSCFPIGYYE